VTRLAPQARYWVRVEGLPVQDFASAVAAIDYAARQVYLPWAKGREALEALKAGKPFAYCYGFKSVEMEPITG
jgi:hypothetical protein